MLMSEFVVLPRWILSSDKERAPE